MRVVNLGGIEFDNPLFIKEEFSLKDVKGKAFNTLNGGVIVYESVKRGNANYITLISKESGWIKKETLDNVLTLLDDLNVEVDLTMDNGSVVKVRPALEKDEVIKVEELFENSKWYRVEIALCRV